MLLTSSTTLLKWSKKKLTHWCKKKHHPPSSLTKYNTIPLTVVELRELCKERGLPVSGTKAEIVLRLNQNDEGVTDGPTEEVAPEETPDAPTEEVAAPIGSEIDEQTTSSDEQEPIIEE